MEKLRTKIFFVLDIFYPLFKRFFNKQTYHYLACGGSNTLFGLFIYYFCYHTILNKQVVNLYLFSLKPHIASFFVSFLVTLPIGFFLSRYVVWSESTTPGKKQLMRHVAFVILSVFMNYGLLKLFVDYLSWWAMPSQLLTTTIIVIFSYITQRYISFK
jgi:putative flippase GtrA